MLGAQPVEYFPTIYRPHLEVKYDQVRSILRNKANGLKSIGCPAYIKPGVFEIHAQHMPDIHIILDHQNTSRGHYIIHFHNDLPVDYGATLRTPLRGVNPINSATTTIAIRGGRFLTAKQPDALCVRQPEKHVK